MARGRRPTTARKRGAARGSRGGNRALAPSDDWSDALDHDPPSKRLAALFFGSAIALAVVIFLLRQAPPGDPMAILESTANNPAAYGALFFLYAVGSTVVLPIPVELGLIIAPDFPVLGKALLLGAGRLVGGLLIFRIGAKLEDDIRHWSDRVPAYAAFVTRMESFVHRYGNVALFALLSVPMMVDTVPLYLFALFNAKGKGKGLDLRGFALANFLGGFTRALATIGIYESFGLLLAR